MMIVKKRFAIISKTIEEELVIDCITLGEANDFESIKQVLESNFVHFSSIR
jgi:hypothetical protein